MSWTGETVEGAAASRRLAKSEGWVRQHGQSGVSPNVGCGVRIGVIGRSGRCGETGLCTRCWAIKNDEHAPTLRAQRDELAGLLGEIMDTASAFTRKPTSEIIIPAPRLDRWWERQIANMVGQVVTIDGRRGIVKWAGPLDGTPEEGASAVVLCVEALDA